MGLALLREKQRMAEFTFDEAELKPYLQLDRMIEAAFDVAGRLFGLTFKEELGIKVWHEDARVWTVLNADGSKRGLLLVTISTVRPNVLVHG